MEVKITTGSYAKEVLTQSASEFVERIKKGESPEVAADAVGMPLPKLLTQDIVKAKLQDLQHYYVKEADQQKKLVISKMIEVLLNGDPRDAVAAAKVLTSNPDLGYGQGAPQVQVNIMSDETRELAKDLDESELWGTK